MLEWFWGDSFPFIFVTIIGHNDKGKIGHDKYFNIMNAELIHRIKKSH